MIHELQSGGAPDASPMRRLLVAASAAAEQQLVFPAGALGEIAKPGGR